MKKYRALFQLIGGSRASFSQEFEYDPRDANYALFERDMENYARRIGANYLYSEESHHGD